MTEEVIVRPVLERKDGIKYLIVPKKCPLVKGDYVTVRKLNTEDKNE